MYTRMLTKALFVVAITVLFTGCNGEQQAVREKMNFGTGWKFQLGDTSGAFSPEFDDSGWRSLNLPHDWSIEGSFSIDNPATPGGGALPGGIGWYRKTFSIPAQQGNKLFFIDFDGVYMNSEVWINGHYLGKRPYGYISFRYDLTSYLHFGGESNVLAVRVDNSLQPNSRWYSGSGIYRNVWLVMTDSLFVDHWGTFVTSVVNENNSAAVTVRTTVRNSSPADRNVELVTSLVDGKGKKVGSGKSEAMITGDSAAAINQEIEVRNPELWSVDHPNLYTAVTEVYAKGKLSDRYETVFGIRYYRFDSQEGFSLNGEPMKLKGVCNHHDLGCLGAAVNKRALERQLEILKEFGCNSIRTSHNPPAPELLDLCDRMGFLVMDEAFDMWKRPKTLYDYHLYWDEWHVRDLQDMVMRDRNHPSVFIWSIGNEIPEQWDTSGTAMAAELASLVRELDNTRPITSGMNDPQPGNFLIKSGALDLIGFNYHQENFAAFPVNFPGEKFIASETTSAIATRGAYDMPSDSVRIWPPRWDLPVQGNPDFTCSAYDNCRVPWGSTHEESWRLIKQYDFLSGLYIWTGFDYLGEPTPYWWPARSSYFGIVDLAGFRKDAFYMYQSEWTNKPVLHIFPHWNWKDGDTIDVWAFTNCVGVELFINGNTLGTQYKDSTKLHLVWKVAYVPGELKAVGKKADGELMTATIKTAGEPAKILLNADRGVITGDGTDLSFVTVTITDSEGNIVPRANNLVSFAIEGAGFIAGVDNGHQISMEPFKANYRRAFNGKCLAVIQALDKQGAIKLTATSEGLETATLDIKVVKP
jgi:beta-galactosidase